MDINSILSPGAITTWNGTDHNYQGLLDGYSPSFISPINANIRDMLKTSGDVLPSENKDGYVSDKTFNDIIKEANSRGIVGLGWDNKYRPENTKDSKFERSVLLDIVCDKLVRYILEKEGKIIKQNTSQNKRNFSFLEHTVLENGKMAYRSTGVITKTPWFEKKSIPLGPYSNFKYNKADRLYVITPIYHKTKNFVDVRMHDIKQWTTTFVLKNGVRLKKPVNDFKFSLYFVNTPSLKVGEEHLSSAYTSKKVATAMLKYDVLEHYMDIDDPKFVSLINKFSKFTIDLEDTI
jgi:hypothetical protein